MERAGGVRGGVARTLSYVASTAVKAVTRGEGGKGGRGTPTITWIWSPTADNSTRAISKGGCNTIKVYVVVTRAGGERESRRGVVPTITWI